MILVTGGTGLVGSHLLYNLVTKDVKVRAIYRSEERRDYVKHIFSYYSSNSDLFSKIEWVNGDITDISSLSFAFNSVTHVYHCAALISFDPKDYLNLRCVNIEGTANVVNACISHNIKKICYVSTIAVINDDIKSDIINENTEWNSEADHSVYAITKYGAEMEVWRGTQEGLDAIIVNPGVILGPGFWYSGSGSLFNHIYKGIPYYTNGVTGYVDVKDVALAMERLMDSTIKNERFILVSEGLSFKTVFQTIAKALNVKPPNKEASKTLLNIGWRLDWMNAFFRKKRRNLTKQNATSLLKISHYDNSKIKNAIGFNYTTIKNSINEYANLFLEEL